MTSPKESPAPTAIGNGADNLHNGNVNNDANVNTGQHRLLAHPQWILWKRESEGDRTHKRPLHPNTLRPHDAHDPGIWLSYNDAASMAALCGPEYGAGFVLTRDDPFFFVDLDDCALPDGSGWTAEALGIVGRFPGAFVEVSQSGRGLHIIGSGDVPAERRIKDPHGHFDGLYTSGRFVAITWHGAQGDETIDHTAALHQLVAERLTRDDDATPADWTNQPRPDWNGHADDGELIARARQSVSASNVFGERAAFTDLWDSDADRLAAAFPPNSVDQQYDASAADAALAQHLAFWTGADCERIERLMWRSRLAREKWRKRPNYLPQTILKAVGRLDAVHGGDTPEQRRARQLEENARIGEETEEAPVPTVLALEDMLRDLVYVGDNGGVVHRGTGRVRKREAAAGEYAASKHRWIDDNGKEKEAPALKCWLAHRARVSVDVMAWVPGEPEICQPPEIANGNTRAYNTWRGLRPMTAPDNWQEWSAPFEQHIAYLVPDPGERRQFIQWLAHIVQRPEELPHTAYLMVTEQTGIGRNWLASVMVRVLRGYVAAGLNLGAILDNKFNGRLSQKLLAVVDETREGMSEQRYKRGERLKSLVTEEHRHIDTKYGLQTVEKNCARWLMFSNHYDALPFDNTDRRIIVIENPTERKPPEYYGRLYSLLGNSHFPAAVRQYLEAVDLSDFNAGAHAPMNASKQRVLNTLMTDYERAVAEFREVWPGPLAWRSNVNMHVQHACSGSLPRANHITNAIRDTGMVNTSYPVKVGMQTQAVVIVDLSQWSAEQVKAASNEQIKAIIQQATEAFHSPG